jgi:hypothetical protein
MNHPTHSGRDKPEQESSGEHADPQSPPLKDHERARPGHSERQVDKALEDTFPASDPPATGGVTRIDPSKPSGKRASREPDGGDKRR